ncbi:NADH-quinone oxidoreductase subunit N, partial [bacterium]|nr:NADH-quinone oxidoreductase subunit N [bacterium]
SLTFGQKFYKISSRIALLAVLLPLITITCGIIHGGYSIFAENYIQTNFTMVIRVLILMGSFFTILLSQNIIKKFRFRAFEYYTILLISIFSSMCLAGANDFIPMIVSLAGMSLSNTILISYWNKYKNKEASIKYLITSLVSAGFLLFGISILYGISGELNFTLLSLQYYGQDSSILFVLASIFIISGLMFHTNCMPFNRWIPDVYQGSPYPVCAYLSYVPVVSAFGIMSRLLGSIMKEAPLLQFLLSIISILTIAYGLFSLIRQKNIKRFLGYSTVAQSGFMLLGLSIFSNYGVSSFVYFAIVYLFINYGIWAGGITFVSCSKSDLIEDYRGLFYVRPYYTTAFVICVTALAGLPPTAGFLSKLYLFCSSMRIDLSGLPVLFIILLLTIIGIYGYFNLIGLMFDKTKKNEIFSSSQMNTKIVLYFCTIMTIITCFFANQIIWLSMFAALGI